MKTSNLGLYLHIPFCLQKCHYCDFYSEAGTSPALRAKYVDALCAEIVQYGRRLGRQAEEGGRLVDTVFLGGGTPSLLEKDQTVRIISAVFDNFRIACDAEVSMECNPATLTAEKLEAYRKAGINRLSMGVQSMEPSILSIMGRIHRPEDVLSNFRLAREAGFENINLDVMFGVPGQDMEIWKDTVRKVLSLEPEHLSFYSLEVAEGTEFYRRLACGMLQETAPEKDREMYHWMLQKLDGAGYRHYEISNAALPGKECRHNLKYWNLEDYLGLGAAAHSFIAGRRFSNAETVSEYAQALGDGMLPVKWHQENTWEDSLTDYMFTALRKTEGVRKKDFAQKTGRQLWDVFADRRTEFEAYKAAGDAAEDENAVWITRKGMDIASRIIGLFL